MLLGYVLWLPKCPGRVLGLEVDEWRPPQGSDDPLSAELASHMGQVSPGNASAPSGEQLRWALAEVERLLWDMRTRDLGAPRAVAEAELTEAQRREWGQTVSGRAAQGGRDWGSRRGLGTNNLLWCWPVMVRVQKQLTSIWEENQSLATRIRDQLAQYEAGLMDLREALNHAVNTTREADELNSRNQERLNEALVSTPASCPLFLRPTLSPLPAPLQASLLHVLAFYQLSSCSPSSPCLLSSLHLPSSCLNPISTLSLLSPTLALLPPLIALFPCPCSQLSLPFPFFLPHDA